MSITVLDHYRDKEDIIGIIAPFFEQNMKLQSIDIDYYVIDDFHHDGTNHYTLFMKEILVACMCTNKHLRCVSFWGLLVSES